MCDPKSSGKLLAKSTSFLQHDYNPRLYLSFFKELDASSCGLRELPHWLIHSCVKSLDVADNQITVIPGTYLRIYWIHPARNVYQRGSSQTLFLNKNSLLSPTARGMRTPKTASSLLHLAANIVVRDGPSVMKEEYSGKISLLPAELREIVSTVRECDRCKKRFAVPVKTVRFQQWETVRRRRRRREEMTRRETCKKRAQGSDRELYYKKDSFTLRTFTRSSSFAVRSRVQTTASHFSLPPYPQSPLVYSQQRKRGQIIATMERRRR